MTRTAAADAVVPACPRASVACPVAAGTAIASTGSASWPDRPGRARPPLVRHRPGPPHRHPLAGNAATLAGWPADPGRDL